MDNKVKEKMMESKKFNFVYEKTTEEDRENLLNLFRFIGCIMVEW